MAGERAGGRGDLLVAFGTLRHLAAVVAAGRQPFEADPDRRAHLRYLWIVAGTRLQDFSAAHSPPVDGGEFWHVVALRHKLARTSPERIDDRLLWSTSQQRAMALARKVATTLDALG